MIVKVHKFRGRNSLRREDCNSPTLNHVYLFNEAMFFIFLIYLSHLIIPVGRIHFGPYFAIRVPFTENNFSEKLILGLDDYELKD